MSDSQPYAYATTTREMVSAYKAGKILVRIPEKDSVKRQGYGLFPSVKNACEYLHNRRLLSGSLKAPLVWDLVFLPRNTRPWRYIIPVLCLDLDSPDGETDTWFVLKAQPANCSEKL